MWKSIPAITRACIMEFYESPPHFDIVHSISMSQPPSRPADSSMAWCTAAVHLRNTTLVKCMPGGRSPNHAISEKVRVLLDQQAEAADAQATIDDIEENNSFTYSRFRNRDGWSSVWGRLVRTKSVIGRLWDDHFRHLGHPPKIIRVQDAGFIHGSSSW